MMMIDTKLTHTDGSMINQSRDGPSSETFKHVFDAAILTILCDNSYFTVFILLSQ